MFDIGSAVVLGLVLTGLVSLTHTLVVGPNGDRVKVAICLAVSIVAVQLVAASDFAAEQVVLNRHLNALNFWSQMVIALLLSGIASGIWLGLKSVSNIGQPMPKYPTAKANGKQPVAGTGLTGAGGATAAPPANTVATGAAIQALLDAPADNGYPNGVPPTDADVLALGAQPPAAPQG